MKLVNTQSVRRRLLIVGGALFIAAVGVFYLARTLSCEGLGCLANAYLAFFIGFPLALFGAFAVLLSLFLKFHKNPSRGRRLLGKGIIVFIIISLGLAYVQYLVPDSFYTTINAVVKNEAMCKIPGYGNYLCTYDLALLTRNESLCAKVPSHERLCYERIAQMKNDETICENLSGQNAYHTQKVKDDCYKGMGVVKDIELCEKINNKEQKDDCYQKARKINAGDISVCTSIPIQPIISFERNDCFFWAALAQGDSNLCKEIDESRYRIACQDAI